MGYREIDPLDSKAVSSSITYIFSPKYSMTSIASYDFGIKAEVFSLIFTRMGSDLQASVGVSYNSFVNSFNFTFQIVPNVAAALAMADRHGPWRWPYGTQLPGAESSHVFHSTFQYAASHRLRECSRSALTCALRRCNRLIQPAIEPNSHRLSYSPGESFANDIEGRTPLARLHPPVAGTAS